MCSAVLRRRRMMTLGIRPTAVESCCLSRLSLRGCRLTVKKERWDRARDGESSGELRMAEIHAQSELVLFW